MWSLPYIVWVRQEQPSVSCEQRSHVWVIGSAEQVVMAFLSSHRLPLSVAAGGPAQFHSPEMSMMCLAFSKNRRILL